MKGAIELAFARARRDATTPGAPPLPKAIRPMLGFSRLPSKARATVRDTLDHDEAFRARTAEGVHEGDLDRASWLFLTREEGWAEEFALLRDAAFEEAAESSASRESHSAQRRLVQVEAAMERLREELSEARQGALDNERNLTEERAVASQAKARIVQLETRLADVEDGRRRVIQNLKSAKELAGSRLEELRVVKEKLALSLEEIADRTSVQGTGAAIEPVSEANVPVDPGPLPSRWEGIHPEAVAEAVGNAARAAELMSEALGSAARLMTPEPSAVEVEPATNAAPGATGGASTEPPLRPPRRSPVRLVRGALEGSVEALGQLFDLDAMVVVVDGYNVSMEAWPHMDQSGQRRSLISMLGALKVRGAADVHVVFDGDDAGTRPTVTVPLPIRVHFSHVDVEADDVILDMVAGLPTDRPVTVVSTDRRVRDGASRLGANLVRSSELIAFARR